MRKHYVLVALLFDTSNAFRPPLVSEELGCSPTLSVLLSYDYDKKPFFFDPLGLATDSNFSRLREAELKHSRIAMLAATETMVIPILKRLHLDWLPSNLPHGLIKTLTSLQTADLIKVVITCGILESVIFVQRDATDMPGDYGTGYFGVRDKGLHERELTVELENGRLAMLALLVQFVAELLTEGKPWDQQWILLFKRWAQDL